MARALLALAIVSAQSVAGQERELALFTDLRTGRAMLVRADVPHQQALQWLTEIAQQGAEGELIAPKGATVIQLSRPPLSFELAPATNGPVADYRNMRTGRHLFVQAATPPASAAEWFATVNDLNDVQAVNNAIGRFRQAGLLGVQFVVGDTEIRVYRGRTKAVEKAIVTRLSDMRTGRVLVVGREATDSALVSKWQGTLIDAKTPADLASLVTANQPPTGLRAATMAISECDCRVTVSWK